MALGPRLRTPPKFHERTPKREKKERQLWRGEGKKREILGSPPFVAPPFGAPPFGAPTLARTVFCPPQKTGGWGGGWEDFGLSRTKNKGIFFGLSRARPPRPPSATWGSNKSSANAPGKKSHNPVPKKGKDKGQSKDAGPPVQEPHGSQAKPQPRRAVEGGADRRCQVGGSNHGDWRRGSRSGRSEGGACEGKGTSSVASCARPDSTHRGFLGPIQEEDGGTERRSFQNPRSQVQPSPLTVPTDPQEEIRLLRARIAQMEGSMEGAVQEAKRFKICATTCPDVTPICRSGLRLREDFVPGCDEDILRWMQDRQADMQEATLAGDGQEVARLCHIMGTAATSWSTVAVTPSMVSNAVR